MSELLSLLTLVVQALLEHGVLGIFALSGWSLTGFFLYKDFKKKDAVPEEIKKKSEIIKSKDEDIKELNNSRVNDLKEITSDYNSAITEVNHTLDKLTVALHVRNSK